MCNLWSTPNRSWAGVSGLQDLVLPWVAGDGTEMRLHASVARWTSQSGPDKHLLVDLSRTAA
jgi:hypothetical protein